MPNSTTPLVSWYNAQFYGGHAKEIWKYREIVEEGGWAAERVVLGVLTSKAEGVRRLRRVIGELRQEFGERFGGIAGWEYWDSGTDDREIGTMAVGGEPWKWVQRVAEAIFDD